MEAKKETLKKIGEKLKALRNLYGMTQHEFAKKIGATRVNINSYENGISPITPFFKKQIAQFIGVGLDYFDTDMTLEEAIKKYRLNINKLENNALCYFYDGLENYVNESSDKINVVINEQAMLKIFSGTNGNFVRIKNNEAEPFANSGDIVFIENETSKHKIKDKNIVIYKTKDSSVAREDILVLKAFVVGFGELEFINSNGRVIEEISLDGMVLVGIIRSKITNM